MAIGETWFHMICPTDGIGSDVEPMPPYGETFATCWCGVAHVLTEQIGTAYRIRAARPEDESANGEMLEVWTEEWARSSAP